MNKQIYVEKRPGSGDFAVRLKGASRASAIETTQAKAIETARAMHPNVRPDVERVRHTAKGHPDQWRKA